VKYLRPLRSDDVLGIQNMAALKNMVIAVSLENKLQLGAAQPYEANAIRLLQEQKNNQETMTGMPAIIDVETQLSAGGFNRGYRR
jgi:hypothetical protein